MENTNNKELNFLRNPVTGKVKEEFLLNKKNLSRYELDGYFNDWIYCD
jgi:hypothetical protein